MSPPSTVLCRPGWHQRWHQHLGLRASRMESLGDSRPCRNTHPEVLHVRVLADDDLLVVPPQHAPVPYTGERADPDPPDYDRRGRHEYTLRNLRPGPVERAKNGSC